LRGARDWVTDFAFDQYARLQESQHEPQDLTVLYSASHPLHQQMMIDR
jgi:hypothetical protein